MAAAVTPRMGPPIGRALPASCDHLLDCLAGIFATEEQALAVRRRLQVTHGLLPTQELLLAPAQSGWLRFTRQARSWARGRDAEGQSWVADAPLMALLSGFVLSLAVAIWLIVGDGLAAGAGALYYLLTPLVGAGAGWTVSAWLPVASQYRSFNSIIRSELAAGQWVVLTHDVPWSQQGGVLELMQARAIGWCVVSASRRYP